MSSKAWVAVLLAATFAGCTEAGSCRLALRFPDAAARARTAAVAIWVLDPGRAACDDLLAGRARPDDLEPRAYSKIVAPFASAALGEVPVGEVLFFVAAEDAAGRKILGGCRVVSVDATSAVAVEVALAAMCWPTTEVCLNNFDDDCDGDTDEGCKECSSDRECEDQNPCSVDLCFERSCHHQAFPDTTPCSDGSQCTSGDRCLGGLCQGEARDCSAFDAVCLVGDCDPLTGECLAAPRTDGTACDDSRFCTDNDNCVTGECTGQPLACDDSDPCTRDDCSEGDRRCTHVLEPLDLESPAVSGTCANDLDDDCDRLTDAADPGCLSCADHLACDDSNPCTRDSCVLTACVNEPLAEGTPCEDGRFCSVGETCAQGLCRGGRLRDCLPGTLPCEEGFCLEDRLACEVRPRGDGQPCDDGDYCTVSDACEAGTCLGRARPCDDSDDCTADRCEASERRCLHTPVPWSQAEALDLGDTCANRKDDDCDGLTDQLDPGCIPCTENVACDDHNACTADTCVETRCQNQPVVDGVGCDDGRACTEGDQCKAGLCTGAVRDCSEQDDPCNEGFCDEAGACATWPRPDGTPCDDGLFCTTADRCAAGKCQGIDRSCDDIDGCTLDTCDAESQVCAHGRVEKPGGEGPPGGPRCSNGIDDDCDLLVDGADFDCMN